MARRARKTQPVVSRRAVLAAAASATGGFFIGSSTASAALELTIPRSHACVDVPKVDPATLPIDRPNTSPVELAIALSSTNPAIKLQAQNAVKADTPPFLGLRSPAHRAAYNNIWTDRQMSNKTLLVAFVNNTPLIDMVMEVVRKSWGTCCALKFEKTNERSRAHIRVRFNIASGHYSHVGIKARDITDLNEPTMNLGMFNPSDVDRDKTYAEWVIRHEFGHAIGCIHEHNRPDIANPFNTAAAVEYFRKTQGWDQPTTQLNVIARFQEQIIRASEFDELSVMHYWFPAQIMADGRERKLNPKLSSLDCKYAALLYGPGSGTVDDQSDEKTPTGTARKTETTKTQKLTVDGSLASVRLSGGGKIEGTFTISDDDDGKDFTVYTEGNTQVVLALYGPDDASANITPKHAPGHGTPDLTNDAIQMKLASGDYVVKVRHVSAGGGGSFALGVKSGRKFGARLLDSNAAKD